MLSVTVEYGVYGYVAYEQLFEARTVTSLIKRINLATAEFLEEVAHCDNEDGDLRQYTPEFGNGYPSLGGFEPEFGEEINGCLTKFTLNGKELEYNSVKHRALRAKTGMG